MASKIARGLMAEKEGADFSQQSQPGQSIAEVWCSACSFLIRMVTLVQRRRADHGIGPGILPVSRVCSALPLPASFYGHCSAPTFATEHMTLQGITGQCHQAALRGDGVQARQG
jgi:hypothetical protein